MTKHSKNQPCATCSNRTARQPNVRCCIACPHEHTVYCEQRHRYPDRPTPDVPIDVPERYAPYRMEYIDGYQSGLRGPGGYCPIMHRGVEAEARQAAWRAGAQQCRKDGRVGPPAVEIDFAKYTGTNQTHQP